MLALVVLEQLECRAPGDRPCESRASYNTREEAAIANVRVHDVGMRDRSLLRDVINADVVGGIEQKLDDRLRPIRSVAQ